MFKRGADVPLQFLPETREELQRLVRQHEAKQRGQAAGEAQRHTCAAQALVSSVHNCFPRGVATALATFGAATSVAALLLVLWPDREVRSDWLAVVVVVAVVAAGLILTDRSTLTLIGDGGTAAWRGALLATVAALALAPLMPAPDSRTIPVQAADLLLVVALLLLPGFTADELTLAWARRHQRLAADAAARAGTHPGDAAAGTVAALEHPTTTPGRRF